MTDKKDIPDSQYFVCKDEALILLRKYHDGMEQMVVDRTKLFEEYDKKMAGILDSHQAKLREIWRRMSAMVGLDPDVTWGNNEYQPEIRFLKDGFGAIIFTPSPVSPFAKVFGEKDDDQKSPAVEKAPDKSRLN